MKSKLYSAKINGMWEDFFCYKSTSIKKKDLAKKIGVKTNEICLSINCPVETFDFEEIYL